MMKKTIFTLVLLALMSYVSAQTIQFEWDGHVYGVGETVECTNDEFGYGEYIQHMQIRNLTSGDLNIIVEKEIIQDLEGTMIFFCWGQCFSPDVFVSPNPVVVEANTVTADGLLSFHTMFEEGVYGQVKVRYFAYEQEHPDARIYVDVVFNKSGVGVAENSVEFGRAYPNPASSTVHFNYEITSGNRVSVSVYNLLGQEVMSQNLDALQGVATISVAGLNEGIYFCNLVVNGQTVKTEKFVVKK